MMLDKEKLWIGISVYFPVDTLGFDRAEIMNTIAHNFHKGHDDSISYIVMPKHTDDPQISVNVECIYDPNNGNDEKYNAFFEEAKKYIENFNKEYEKA